MWLIIYNLLIIIHLQKSAIHLHRQLMIDGGHLIYDWTINAFSRIESKTKKL